MSTSQPIRRSTLSRRWQFSLLTLLIAMTWVGLACVALSSPSEVWTGLIFVLAVGSLLVAGLCIVYRTGRSRAFAIGFVIFSAAYLYISMGDTPDVADAHTQLPTTRWGMALYATLHGDKVQSTNSVGIYSAPLLTAAPLPVTALPPPPLGATVERVVMTTASGSNPALAATAAGGAPVPGPALVPVTTYIARTSTQPLVPLASFLEVVHYLLAIFLGVIGGVVAQTLYATRREDQPQQQSAA